MQSDYLCRLLLLVAASCAAGSAAAAVAVVMPITDLPWLQLAVGVAIAAAGGAADIAMRAVSEIRRSEEHVRAGGLPMPPPPLMPAALLDLLIACVAGLFGMGLGGWGALNHWQMLLVLLACGMLGSRLLQPWAAAFLDGATESARRLGSVLGSRREGDK